MPAERQPTLFSELIPTPEVFSVVEPLKITASSLINLSMDDRRSRFKYEGPVHLEVDIPVHIRKFWRLGKEKFGVYNGSVNPLVTLRYNDREMLRELSQFFGEEKGKIPIPVGSIIEGQLGKNTQALNREFEFVRVVSPARK